MIAAISGMLHKLLHGVDSAWFIFGSIFLCSLCVFVVFLLRPAAKPPEPKKESLSDRLEIDSFSETMRLGSLWTVPITTHANLSIELLEIANENEVTIEVNSTSIQYAGRNVRVLQKAIIGGKYVLPRATIAYGDDCVCHWDINENHFSGFYVFVTHANKFAQEATINVFGILAYKIASSCAPEETIDKIYR